MPEYTHTETRWKCDFCSRDVKKGATDPPGWHEARSFYGNSLICCPDCVERFKTFVKEEDGTFEIPESMK